MNKLNQYTYTILRYVHDIVAGEFINVGVLIQATASGEVLAKMRHTYGRLKQVFPSMDGDDFRRTLVHIERAIDREREHAHDLFEGSKSSALAVAKRVLPLDDSSFQWAPQGGGVAANLEEELVVLFDRMVSTHEVEPPARIRTESDVWRTFSRPLVERKLITRLKPKEIVSDSDRLTFEHAWKNGRWNCLQPVSFDHVDKRRVHDKAIHWVGQATTLESAKDDFKLFMLVGEPRLRGVRAQFDRALKMLDSMPCQKAIYLESEAEKLSEYIAKDLREHDSASR